MSHSQTDQATNLTPANQFTPRIAALYGYTLLWALIAAVVLKWFINREVGRFNVCTGITILEGLNLLLS